MQGTSFGCLWKFTAHHCLIKCKASKLHEVHWKMNSSFWCVSPKRLKKIGAFALNLFKSCWKFLSSQSRHLSTQEKDKIYKSATVLWVSSQRTWKKLAPHSVLTTECISWHQTPPWQISRKFPFLERIVHELHCWWEICKFLKPNHGTNRESFEVTQTLSLHKFASFVHKSTWFQLTTKPSTITDQLPQILR